MEMAKVNSALLLIFPHDIQHEKLYLGCPRRFINKKVGEGGTVTVIHGEVIS